MSAEKPPLDRLLLYLRTLEKLRTRQKEIEVPAFIDAVEELAPKTVRDDLRALGISLSSGSKLNLDDTYWIVVREQPSVERESLEQGLQLELPAATTILAQIPQTQRPDIATAFGTGPRSAVDAARMLDLAFDVSVENPELYLLGHGRMIDGQVAYRHQINTARHVLEDMRGTAIIADEVGLGKTNVGGLILEEVLAHNPQATALILVPANLREQWADEELPKFFSRQILSDIRKASYPEIENAQLLLLSLDQAKGTGTDSALSELLRRRLWDLLIVDEAHDCRNAERLRFRFVYSIRARRRIFITATPIHNSGYDIFNLVTLLKPGYFGQRRFFAEKHMAGERIIKDHDVLQKNLAPIMTRTVRQDTDIPFAKREITLVEISDFKDAETKLYDELLNLLKGIYRRHMGASAKIARTSGHAQHVSQFVLIAMLVLREMASHPLAAIQTLHTALRKRVQDLATITRDDSDLARLDDFIKRYTSQSWDVAHHAKSERLLTEAAKLFASEGKFVVYVNYLKTHEILMKLLAEQNPDCTIIGYHGKLGQENKTEARSAFKKEGNACLVSTDAGGQGLNLQFAHCVLNYDFPWNPMRVEQRIGRVDRVNQKSPVISIFNFRTQGTVEEYVQIVLTNKLKECRSVLGEFMSPLQIEKVYEDKLTMGIGRALMDSVDAADMRRRMSRLGEDELRQYIGDYSQYEKDTPPDWTWRPHY